LIQRMVCFKYKPETTQEQIAEHMNTFSKLPTIVPGIASYRGGLCIPNANGALPEFSSMHYLTFKTLEDMSAYYYNPEHQKFGKFGGEISEKILVINSDISAETTI